MKFFGTWALVLASRIFAKPVAAAEQRRHIAIVGAIFASALMSWAGSMSAFAQEQRYWEPFPGISFEILSGSGMPGNPHIWRVLMTNDIYRRFLATGLKGPSTAGATQPGTWLATTGVYSPMQYIGPRGAWHELRMMTYLQGSQPQPPPTGGSAAVNISGDWAVRNYPTVLRVVQTGNTWQSNIVAGAPPKTFGGTINGNRVELTWGEPFNFATVSGSGQQQLITWSNAIVWARR
jgi:hypothetical protein